MEIVATVRECEEHIFIFVFCKADDTLWGGVGGVGGGGGAACGGEGAGGEGGDGGGVEPPRGGPRGPEAVDLDGEEVVGGERREAGGHGRGAAAAAAPPHERADEPGADEDDEEDADAEAEQRQHHAGRHPRGHLARPAAGGGWWESVLVGVRVDWSAAAASHR